MDTLPNEIYDEILRHLKHSTKASWPFPTRLALYSTINRKWQRIVERDIFRHICINSSELLLWKDVVESRLGASRRSAIRTVTFATYHTGFLDILYLFDQLSEEACRDSDMEFSRSIDDFFQLLGKWHNCDTVTNDRMGCIHLSSA